MTEKELRKLNRLEILELLLEQSEENDNLRQEILELKNKNEDPNEIRNLEKMILQLNSALNTVNRISENLNKTTKTEFASEVVENETEKIILFDKETDADANKNLYGRIMYYFWQNDDALSSLPDELQNEIRKKLRGISND